MQPPNERNTSLRDCCELAQSPKSANESYLKHQNVWWRHNLSQKLRYIWRTYTTESYWPNTSTPTHIELSIYLKKFIAYFFGIGNPKPKLRCLSWAKIFTGMKPVTRFFKANAYYSSVQRFLLLIRNFFCTRTSFWLDSERWIFCNHLDSLSSKSWKRKSSNTFFSADRDKHPINGRDRRRIILDITSGSHGRTTDVKKHGKHHTPNKKT